MNTTWTVWIRTVTRGASARAIATRINRSHSSVAKWIRDGDPPCEVIIAICRAYRANPIAGLVAAGYIREGELTPHMREIIRMAPVADLTGELNERAMAWEASVSRGREFEPWFPTRPELRLVQ